MTTVDLHAGLQIAKKPRLPGIREAYGEKDLEMIDRWILAAVLGRDIAVAKPCP